MKNNIIMEIVEFKIIDSVEENEFFRIVNDLEINFHSKQKGFIDTELLKGKEEYQYIMVQHWDTMENCKEVIGKMMKESITEEFRNIIDAKTVKMTLLPQIKKWE